MLTDLNNNDVMLCTLYFPFLEKNGKCSSVYITYIVSVYYLYSCSSITDLFVI